MEIIGNYKKAIFTSNDGYYIGLFKVKDPNNKLYNDKVITFTGYFPNLMPEDNLVLEGEFINHPKYGTQFKVNNFKYVEPTDENTIINFLSSGLFKGIGEKTATKIYDTLGSETINIIKKDPDRLNTIKGLSKKNIEIIKETMLLYIDSIDIIKELNDYGFNTKEATCLYHKYKSNTLDLLKNDIYNFVNEDTNFSFKKVDLIAIKNDYNYTDIRRIKAGIIYVFTEVINTIGDTYLNLEDIYNYLNRALSIYVEESLFKEALDKLMNENKIILYNEKYYLKKMYDAENNIARRLVYLSKKENIIDKNIDKLIINNEYDYEIEYDELQKEAIKSSFKNDFVVITGGPGTGKTTIIKSIVSIYKKLNKISDRDLTTITLLAPTGRAAKRMMESTHLPAQTIHRFLKWNKENNKFGINEYNKVDTELVIIDESSMIDTYLLDSLIKGLKYNTKIIMVGDYNQLPSVGSGCLLKDIIDTNIFKVIKLERLYRQKENSNIINLAYDINNIEYNPNLFNKTDDLTLIESDSYNLKDNFIDICNTYKDLDYNDYIILAPMYKTMNGIDNLNVLAQSIINPSKTKELVIGEFKYKVGDKVINNVNMPDDNIYNGDIGKILDIDLEKKELKIDFDGNIVTFNKTNYNNFKLGYVISIHKSQGSEFKIVIMTILNEYNRMLYRKLIYTGVTRAKRKLIILGNNESIIRAINNNSEIERKTTLKEFILERI